MKSIKIIASFLLLVTVLWAGSEIASFTGYAENSRIIIQWSTNSEYNVTGFEIQRSTDGNTFFGIGTMNAQGESSSYTYIDDSIIAKVSGRAYYYRLKIRNSQGKSSLSEIIAIQSNISSVNHTWGSLKALFK